MSLQNTLQDTKEMLKRHGQSRLLAFWEQLNNEKRQDLLVQIRGLDFEKIQYWIDNCIKKPAAIAVRADLKVVESYPPAPADARQKQKYAQAIKLGQERIRQGKVAALVVAGGQGTRLGFDGPKGNFPISPVKNKTLFQIFAETIAAARKKYKTVCPWYIMTSPLNHAATIKIFKSNGYYGLGEKNVFIFQQGTLPNFSPAGKILLADKATIACSPDGHGGCIKALYKSGAVEDMKRRGVEYLSYWQVDNPLINIFDPLFIGLHILDGAQMSSKALVKTGPMEKLGNFCLSNGRLNVIEYSDFPDELANKRNPDGSLVFQLGSIAIHIINRSFAETLNGGDLSLPVHKAVKKIRHVTRSCDVVVSEGIKLESFIFDALPLAEGSIILQTVRSQEFAPTKNATGVDSVDSTRAMMVERAVDWLESAGVTIPKKPDGSPDCLLEIAPGFALAKDDVKAKLGRIPRIKANDKLYLE